MITALILLKSIWSGYTKVSKKDQIVLAIIFGHRLIAGHGLMLIEIVTASSQMISTHKSKQLKNQDNGLKLLQHKMVFRRD